MEWNPGDRSTTDPPRTLATGPIARRFLAQGLWVCVSGGTALGAAIGVSIIVLFGLVHGLWVLFTNPLREDFAAVLGVSVPTLGAIGAKLSVARLTPPKADWTDRTLLAVAGALVGGSIGLGPFVIASFTAFIFGSIFGALTGSLLTVPVAATLAILTIVRHRPLTDERRYRREARAAATVVVFGLSGPGLAVLSSTEGGIDWEWVRDPTSYVLLLIVSTISAVYTLWLVKHIVRWYVDTQVSHGNELD